MTNLGQVATNHVWGMRNTFWDELTDTNIYGRAFAVLDWELWRPLRRALRNETQEKIRDDIKEKENM